MLCRSFLAVRAETDISLAKYARLPSVTLLTKNPRNEFLSPFEVIITVAFCQYDNTIDWSYHHHPLRRLGADRVRGGDRLARLGRQSPAPTGLHRLAGPESAVRLRAIAPASVGQYCRGGQLSTVFPDTGDGYLDPHRWLIGANVAPLGVVRATRRGRFEAQSVRLTVGRKKR